MKYFLQRDGRNFGPYSLDDLKRYQSEGRIGPDDTIRSEDSDKWIPQTEFFNPPAASPAPVLPPAVPAPVVAPVVPAAPSPFIPVTPPADNPFAAPAAGSGFGAPLAGNSLPTPPAGPGFGGPPAGPGFGGPPAGPGFGGPPAGPGFGGPPAGPGFGGPPAGPGFGGPPAGGSGVPRAGAFGAVPNPAASGAWPAPPDMQWYLVLIIGLVTCSIFTLYWIYNQCQFVKKLDPASKGLTYYLAGFGLIFCGVILSGILFVFLADTEMQAVAALVAPLFNLVATVLMILGHFNLRTSIERHYNTVENIGLKLSPVMTFFFNIFYFQYHFARIAEWKKTGRLA
jgi:hypothetical protein